MQSNNICVIAAAGSRKTTSLVERALQDKGNKILITTYTNENLDQIRAYFFDKNGYVPGNVTIMSWYAFLLQEGVRPYRNFVTKIPRISSINFQSQKGRFISRGQTEQFYFDRSGNIYRDGVSDFVVMANSKSGGKVVRRIESIYDAIYIDEMQDLSGHDLEFLDLLMRSTTEIYVVGDPRQSTYSTTNSSKNRNYKGSNIMQWFKKKEKQGICKIEERTECFRCNQSICNFADELYPDLSATTSRNNDVTDHDGIFYISRNEVSDYVQKYQPAILRYNRSADTLGYPARNIGAVKGKTFDRVLVFPTNAMKEYFRTRDISKAGDIAKLYVAVTRARYSVTFVT